MNHKLLFVPIMIFVFQVWQSKPIFAACGSFTENEVLTGLGSPYGVTAADFDGDGDIDIATSEQGTSGGRIIWYKNDGSQVFTAQTAIKTSYSTPHILQSFDFNGDNDPDLISAQDPTSSGDNDDVLVFLNNGTGTSWTEKVVDTDLNGMKQVDVMDIDKDTDLDVVVADSNDDNVMWYENDGSGNFGGENTVVTSFNAAVGACMGDVDGDTEVDVVVAGQASSDIIWYKNNGSEVFTPDSPDVDSSYNGWYCEQRDLDDDGDLDIIVTDYYGAQLTWYKNDGSGNFDPADDIDTTASDLTHAIHPHVADLDNDGDEDIVVSAASSNKFIWYENNGSENFTKNILKTSTDARDSFIVDLDGDGYIDILHASLAEGKIFWWESNCTDPVEAQLFFAP